MNRTCFAVAALAAGSSALASVNYTGGTLTENFDTLSLTTVAGAFSATAGTQAAIPGLSSWDGAKIAGTGTNPMNFIADAGGSNTGALFSYGVLNVTERALGALASGTNAAGFGLQLINTSTDTFASLTFSFDREQWRSSTTTANVLSFAYGFSGGSTTGTNYLTDAGMTPHAPGNLVGDAPVTTNGALPPNVAAVSFTISNIAWAPGQSLFIRWTDFNDVGNDAGLALDNFNFTAQVPAPTAAAALGLLGAAGLRRRR